MRLRKSLLIALMIAAAISSRAHTARAQAGQPTVTNEEVSAIFGTLAFDSLSQFARLPAGTRFFTADSVTFRRLSPQASKRGVRFEVARGGYTSCPWSSDSPDSSATVQTGLLLKLATRVDSTGHAIASVRLECRLTFRGAPVPNRGGYSVGVAVELVKSAGKWRVAKVVDHWIT